MLQHAFYMLFDYYCHVRMFSYYNFHGNVVITYIYTGYTYSMVVIELKINATILSATWLIAAELHTLVA